MDKMKVALCVGGISQQGWVHEIAEWLAEQEEFECGAVIVADGELPAAPGLPWTGTTLSNVARLEGRMLETRYRTQLVSRDLSSSLAHGTPVLPLTLTLGPAGSRVAADPAQIQAIAGLGLDAILVLGLPAVRGGLSGAARRGAWLLAHSELGGQADVTHAGFWEVYQRADHTTLKLWRLGETESVGDELLDMRSFNTEMFWLKNRARALSLGNLMVYDTLRSLRLPEGRKSTSTNNLHVHTGMARPVPAPRDGAAYLARQAWLASSMVMRRALKKNVRWRIGMCPTGRQQVLTSDAAIMVPPKCPTGRQQVLTSDAAIMVPPKGRFFADPFVCTRDGRPYIFFEDYYFRERKGKISVATFENGAFDFLGVVLDLPYHLSYPYIFEHEGNTYMVPETCGNRTIELWKCTEFPLKWELSKTLMNNISAVDTIVFPYGGYWWLFTNIDRTDGLSHCDELFAFYAEKPDATEWIPHAQNPIVNSPIKARNAGMVMAEDGSVIRCAQTQGFLHYGKGVSLNRIEQLSPSAYSEVDGPVNYPHFLRKPFASMHHWHHHGGHTVFDFAFME
jgi:hypothetical protein